MVSRGSPPRAYSDRVADRAVHNGRPGWLAERWAQYDVWGIHESTSLFGDVLRQFYDRQERFEQQKTWRKRGIAIRIGPRLIGPCPRYRERAGLGTLEDQAFHASYDTRLENGKLLPA